MGSTRSRFAAAQRASSRSSTGSRLLADAGAILAIDPPSATAPITFMRTQSTQDAGGERNVSPCAAPDHCAVLVWIAAAPGAYLAGYAWASTAHMKSAAMRAWLLQLMQPNCCRLW